MNIAIDISPLKKGHFLLHRVRGTGFYIENLKNSLLKYYPDNKYLYFTQGEKLPEKVELTHCPYFEPFFITLSLIKKTKTIVTVHDLTPFVFPKNFPAGFKGNLKWQIQKFSLKRADGIITDSECSKKDIIKYAGISSLKISVVYLAAGEEYRKVESSSASWRIKAQNLRKKYNLPEKFLLYVGDATWNKNLPRLIEAVNRINLPLVMVGKALSEKNFDKTNPWNQDLIKIQESIKNNSKIIALGFIPTEDLVNIYNLAEVFVMPSLYEGFGLPILEAMSCGCPVITSKEGSLPEIAGDAAVYVDPYDVTNIAAGIKKVFSDKTLKKKLSEIGLEQARKFSWEKTALETLKVYKKAVL
ncbi:glycosyltransferase family 1 protein [Candidatus Microgenomates bacterium]|nr:MAG: glycosyltransferase family 1 protein [Candidatus Microgenomates bacterium]